MSFYALLPVRDEADIIGQCLDHLLKWADKIFVFDTGSIDETWEIVNSFAAKDNRIKTVQKEPVFFSETRLRGYLFHIARQEMRDGDWFIRVDADEFHHIPPPEFVKTRMRRHETVAYHQYYDFRLTETEVKAWEVGAETLADRQQPIEERRRWFIPSSYSEPRLCRYRQNMQWPPTVSFPYNAGFVARERLPIRHYPHRDVVQLRRRCRLRAVMMADHENRANWSKPELHHWAEGDSRNFITPDDLPELLYWERGTALPEFNFTNHLAKTHVRVIQRIVHATCLSMLDRIRPGWPDAAYPQRIPENVLELLQQELRA